MKKEDFKFKFIVPTGDVGAEGTPDVGLPGFLFDAENVNKDFMCAEAALLEAIQDQGKIEAMIDDFKDTNLVLPEGTTEATKIGIAFMAKLRRPDNQQQFAEEYLAEEGINKEAQNLEKFFGYPW